MLVLLILATRLPGVVAGERLSVWDVAYLLVAVVVLLLRGPVGGPCAPQRRA